MKTIKILIAVGSLFWLLSAPLAMAQTHNTQRTDRPQMGTAAQATDQSKWDQMKNDPHYEGATTPDELHETVGPTDSSRYSNDQPDRANTLQGDQDQYGPHDAQGWSLHL